MSIGIYLHFPFCRNKCSYCDFYKELHSSEAEKAFYAALKIETNLTAEGLGDRRPSIGTIFIGGGTPSLTSLELFAEWLAQMKSLFDFEDDLEFSIETNPESVTPDKLEFLKLLGVNRPLFGIQSFNVESLRMLDRRHDPHDSQRAIYLANALGFENFGVDLIFGLPGQTNSMLAADISQLLELDPPHISLYQLTIEENTPLASRVETGEIKLPQSEHMLTLFRNGHRTLMESGYDRYEVCSFAKPGHECRHNLRYWTGDDYIGLGPSAHSLVDGRRYSNIASIEDYIAALNRGELPIVHDRSGRKERIAESIIVGLRMSQGIDQERFLERFNMKLEESLDTDQYRILLESGHLVNEKGHLHLSEEGLLLADEVARRLILD